MTLRQLEYFLAVVDEGSMSRAAQRMFVAQPSLSQQIRTLEAELGADLLERLPRSTRLTAFGREFVSRAREVTLAAERARLSAEQVRLGEAGQIEIATVRSIAVGVVPATLELWRVQHPDTSVRLHEFDHRLRLEEGMAIGIADVAIGPTPKAWDGAVEDLGYEEFVVILPPDDELVVGSENPVPLAELEDRKWVLFEHEHGLSELVDFACAQAGFTPRAAIRTAQVEAAVRLAAVGLGPAVVPANAVPPDMSPMMRRLTPSIGRRLACYARTDFSPLAKAYVSTVRSRIAWTQDSPTILVR